MNQTDMEYGKNRELGGLPQDPLQGDMSLLTLMSQRLAQVEKQISQQIAQIQDGLDRKLEQHYRQTEALFSLFHYLDPVLPLPEMRGWAASPDFLKLVMETILTDRPRLVLEASSGVSTLVTAYCLKKLGGGKVIALENGAPFAAKTQDLINRHGLNDWATVIHAPLVTVHLPEGQWQWYDLSRLPVAIDHIDLFVVDGPPGFLQPLSRYPALPLIADRLSPRATILLDDGDRPDEREIVQRWQNQWPQWRGELLPLEKGAFVLRREQP